MEGRSQPTVLTDHQDVSISLKLDWVCYLKPHDANDYGQNLDMWGLTSLGSPLQFSISVEIQHRALFTNWSTITSGNEIFLLSMPKFVLKKKLAFKSWRKVNENTLWKQNTKCKWFLPLIVIWYCHSSTEHPTASLPVSSASFIKGLTDGQHIKADIWKILGLPFGSLPSIPECGP